MSKEVEASQVMAFLNEVSPAFFTVSFFPSVFFVVERDRHASPQGHGIPQRGELVSPSVLFRQFLFVVETGHASPQGHGTPQ